MHEGTALNAGENLAVDLLGQIFVVGQDDAAARATQAFVGGAGDEIGMWHGIRMHAACDEPCNVSHINKEIGSDAAGNVAHAFEIDDARISGCTSGDHFWTAFFCHLLQPVVVDAFVLIADAVVNDFVVTSGEIGLVAVGKVTTVGKVHRQDAITGF